MAYKAQDFIDKIPGTGGVIDTLAKKVGCSWDTAKKYVTEYATVRTAWEAEKEAAIDLSERLIYNNIRLAIAQQVATNEPVDTGDAKWLLARLRRGQYSEKFNHAIGGEDGGPIEIAFKWIEVCGGD